MEKLKDIVNIIKRVKDYFVTWLKCDFPCNLWRMKITYNNWNLLQLRESRNTRNLDSYKSKISKLKSSFNKIQIHFLFGNRIGECLSRLLDINSDLEVLKSDGNYHVFISNNPIGNRETFKLIDLNGCGEIIIEENLDFWEYVFKNNKELLDYSQYTRYKGRNRIYPITDKPFLSLSEEQQQAASLEFSIFGLEYGNYVCFHARDNGYLTEHFNLEYTPKGVRDFDVKDLLPAMKYVAGKGLKAVRVGQYVNETIDMDYVIDYANMDRSELMDLFLPSMCKYYVGCCSGLFLVPAVFGVPKIILNVDTLTESGGSIPFTQYDSILPIKYLLEKENRLLTFEEMLLAYYKYGEDIKLYEHNGLTVLHNSPEEIIDAIMELEKKISGTYEQDVEGEYLQQLAKEMIKRTSQKYGWKCGEHGGGFECNICASFLKKNKELFGDELKEYKE